MRAFTIRCSPSAVRGPVLSHRVAVTPTVTHCAGGGRSLGASRTVLAHYALGCPAFAEVSNAETEVEPSPGVCFDIAGILAAAEEGEVRICIAVAVVARSSGGRTSSWVATIKEERQTSRQLDHTMTHRGSLDKCYRDSRGELLLAIEHSAHPCRLRRPTDDEGNCGGPCVLARHGALSHLSSRSCRPHHGRTPAIVRPVAPAAQHQRAPRLPNTQR